MKKVFAVLLFTLACFLFAGCSKKQVKPESFFDQEELKKINSYKYELKKIDLVIDDEQPFNYVGGGILQQNDKYFDIKSGKEFVIEDLSDDYLVDFLEEYILLKPKAGVDKNCLIVSYETGKKMLELPFVNGYSFEQTRISFNGQAEFLFKDFKLASKQERSYAKHRSLFVYDKDTKKIVDVIFLKRNLRNFYELNNGNILLQYISEVKYDEQIGNQEYDYKYEDKRIVYSHQLYKFKERKLVDLKLDYIIYEIMESMFDFDYYPYVKNKNFIKYYKVDRERKRLTNLQSGYIDDDAKTLKTLGNYTEFPIGVNKDYFVVHDDEYSYFFNKKGECVKSIKRKHITDLLGTYLLRNIFGFDYESGDYITIEDAITGKQIATGIVAEPMFGGDFAKTINNSIVINDVLGNEKGWKIFNDLAYYESGKMILLPNSEKYREVKVIGEFIVCKNEDKYDVFDVFGNKLFEDCENVTLPFTFYYSKKMYFCLKVKKNSKTINSFYCANVR